jgi:hypothetical protein
VCWKTLCFSRQPTVFILRSAFTTTSDDIQMCALFSTFKRFGCWTCVCVNTVHYVCMRDSVCVSV